MALTYSQYVGDGSTHLFAVTFPYISKSHVKVRVDGNEVPFTWSTPALVQLDMVPSAGAVIDIRRETPNTEPLVDFHDGSTLVESDLDLATIQSLYIAQEVVDRLNAKIGADTDGTINADGRRIKNVALPVASNDVATKGYVDETTGNAPAYAAQAQDAATSASESAVAAATSADVASSAAAQAATSAAEAVENAKKAVTPFIWTAVEGQTEFPFGQVIEPAMVLVFVSGAKFPLGMGDYSITSTKITLNAPAVAGDVVEAYVFAPFTVANAMLPGNNLAELADKAAARANLGLGSAAVLNAGTGANQLLKLDAAGKIPAVPGDLLTGIGRKLISTTSIVAAASADIVLPNGYSAFELVLSGNQDTNYVKIQLRPTGGSLLTGAADYKGCLSGGSGSSFGSTGLAAGTDSWRNCYVAMAWAHSKVLISNDGTLEARHYSTANNSGVGFGACQTPGPYDLVRLTPSAGTLTFTCRLYGIKDAS